MNPEVTKQEYYNDAWTYLMAARRNGDMKEIQRCARRLELAAKELNQEHELAPCSHFIVANGHCINCREPVSITHREHANQMECVHDYQNVPGTHQIKCIKCGLRA